MQKKLCAYFDTPLLFLLCAHDFEKQTYCGISTTAESDGSIRREKKGLVFRPGVRVLA